MQGFGPTFGPTVPQNGFQGLQRFHPIRIFDHVVTAIVFETVSRPEFGHPLKVIIFIDIFCKRVMLSILRCKGKLKMDTYYKPKTTRSQLSPVCVF